MAESRQLINRIKSGDHSAFQTLIETYQRLVSHIVFRAIPNASDREDICQDVFLKVYQNIGGFRFESKVSTWIARIAYNTCINYLQKKKVPLFDDHAFEDETLDSVSGQSQLPDAIAEGKDTASRLQTEIEALDVRYRTILTLYHLDEMSYSEIGKIMNLPEGSVKSYLFRARKRLRKKLLIQYQREEL
jgi:RNA polymerase sigma-70 factor (ECF subfamily)